MLTVKAKLGTYSESEALREVHLTGNTVVLSTTKINAIYLNETCMNSPIKDWSYPVNSLIVSRALVNIVNVSHFSFNQTLMMKPVTSTAF